MDLKPQNPLKLKPSQKQSKPARNYWRERQQQENQLLQFLDYAMAADPADMATAPNSDQSRAFSTYWMA